MVADLTRRQFSLGASALAGSRGGVVSAAGAGLPGGFGVPAALRPVRARAAPSPGRAGSSKAIWRNSTCASTWSRPRGR